MKLMSFIAVLLLNSAVLAQAIDPDLDLPVIDPKLADTIRPAAPPTAKKDPEPEPRDIPPPTIYGEEINAETGTIIYVIDISGSMGWGAFMGSYATLDGQIKSGTRLDRAKVELRRSILSLPQSFKFNMIAYSCITYMWQPTLQQANDVSKSDALAWVEVLTPKENTGTGPATALSLYDKSNHLVVLLTDGEPNCGADGIEGHRLMISRANAHRATINVFGISAFGSWRSFCQQVASDSGGTYIDVP
jgi:hypothetical protein